MKLSPRLALLGLVTGFVSVVAPTAPATAAEPVPCVRTVSGSGGVIAEAPRAAGELVTSTFELQAPRSPALVEDVDVTFAIEHANAAQLRVRLSRGDNPMIVQRRLADSGPQVRPLTWDDEAGAAYGVDSPAGTYVPDQPLSLLDGTPAQGTWRLLVDNWAAVQGRVVSWSVRISYSICDADGDSVEDHSDNCTGAANPDQSDLDGDGIGDTCDDDFDGDGLVGGADNCPLVSNVGQTDTDADALGDACDPDDDGDGRADGSDRCALAPATTSSGCPSVATKVKLRREKSRLVGRVSSDRRACVARVEVTLKRARPGRDQKLVVLTTRSEGKFRTRAPRAGGRLYVVVRSRVAADVAECGASRSRTIRVRR